MQLPTTAPAAILQAQKKSWNRFSTGWETWDELTMRFLEPQGAAIVGALELGEGARVLDIATGTGDPGLTLASRMPGVRVTALDVSEGMLRIARDKGARLGLDNFETVVGNASALDFADDSFDAVCCRLGFMFFPDPEQAGREIARVLRPGGVVATTVWAGPSVNPWVTTFMGALEKHVEVAAPPPGAPGLFRCAEPEAMTDLLANAGLRVEHSQLLTGHMGCRSSDEYWRFMTDVVPPAVNALASATPELAAAIRADVLGALEGPEASDKLGWGARCVVARK